MAARSGRPPQRRARPYRQPWQQRAARPAAIRLSRGEAHERRLPRQPTLLDLPGPERRHR